MTPDQKEKLIDLRATIEPKSDRINADDFFEGARTVTITNVRAIAAEQPIALDLEGMKPYLPCKTMRRVLIAAWGDNGHEWIGRKMTLYCDPDISFGGIKVGGIRISHLSHIDKPLDLLLTTTRAKRKPHHIDPIRLISQEVTKTMFSRINALNLEIEKILTWLGIGSLSDMTEAQAKRLDEILTKKELDNNERKTLQDN